MVKLHRERRLLVCEPENFVMNDNDWFGAGAIGKALLDSVDPEDQDDFEPGIWGASPEEACEYLVHRRYLQDADLCIVELLDNWQFDRWRDDQW